jgi:uncharacterized protein YecT (DUF1311 family)
MPIVLLVTLGALLGLAPAPVSTLARGHPRARCQLVPSTWAPSLDQVRSDVEAKVKAEKNPPQQLLTQMSQNLADLRDAQLLIAYLQLMQMLDAAGQETLFAEQTRWLDTRAAAAQASVTSKGGTLGPLEYSGAFGTITDERLAELRQRLQRQRNITAERKERNTP